MKRTKQITFKIILVSILLLTITCKKDELAKVTKLEIGSESNVTETTATVSATFVDVSANISAFGHCYATSSNPGISDSRTTNSGTAQKGVYSSNLTGLTPDTEYYVRAYAMEGDKEVYSSGQVSFTTGAYQLPTLVTGAVTDVTHNTAVSGGEITDDGGQEITSRGVCWSTSENPTISDDKTVDGTGTGTFTSNLTGLIAETTYYVQAYATNSVGTAYGNEQTFTTSEAPYIAISSPTTGDHWLGLEAGNIIWTSNTGGNVSMTLYNGNTLVTEFVANTENDGIYSWASVIDGQYGYDYKVRITSLENTGLYTESNTFKISESNGSTGILDANQFSYNTIKIGSQWWMAENLKENVYPDWADIPTVSDDNSSGSSDDEWDALGDMDDAFCYYDDSYTNRSTFGTLYNWAAVMNGGNSSSENPSGVQGVCPTGWHVPSDAEWKELESYLGMSPAEVEAATGNRGIDEGSELAGNAEEWNDGALESNAQFGTSGFMALPGGCRFASGGWFYDINTYGYWSSATEYEDDNSRIWYRELSYIATGVSRFNGSKSYGFSVRCVRD